VNIINTFDKNKLCYDLSLIYAENSLNELGTDDPYINQEHARVTYLIDSFKMCYSILYNKDDKEFKQLY